MPIYEFYCPSCHMIFNFFSKSVNTTKRPMCPRCKKKRLERRVSLFSASSGKGGESGEDLPVDEGKMEEAITKLAGEAENIDENDPRQAAGLMRKLSDMTGIKYGKSMEEAVGRMESGEDPERIEEEMGDLMEEEEPFEFPGKKGGPAGKPREPARDRTLYEL
ncbi:MAG: zinc ribbon domain-containing protein [Kiritimatiellia bacterium]